MRRTVRVVVVDSTGLAHRVRSDVVVGDDEALRADEGTGAAAPGWSN